MKKILASVLVIAAAALTFASCQKQEVSAPAGNTRVVTFVADQISTRTAFGTASGTKIPTLWTSNDANIAVAQNFSNYKTATVTPSADFKSATFDVALTDDESGSYTFYAISPKTAVVSGVNASYFSWNVEIPNEQTPAATSPDEAAMILAATSATSTTFPESKVALSFKHLTAYLDLTISNLSLQSGDAVASYTISADEDICSRWYYYVGGDNEGKLIANTPQDAITVKTSETGNVWVAIAPVPEGTTFTVAVNTANAKLYKTTFTTGADLLSGNVGTKTVDFTGVKPEEDQVYTLVTDLSELTDGAKVIIATPSDADAYAMGVGTSSLNYIPAVSAEKSSDGTKIINPASVDVFTLSAGTKAGTTVSFLGENGYLFAKSSSSNTMGVETTLSANSSWAVSFEDETTHSVNLVAQGANTRNNIRYNPNNGSPRFSCYAATSSVTTRVAIYKLEGSGSSTQLITGGDDPGETYTYKKASAITSGKTYVMAHTEDGTTYYATVLTDPSKDYGYYYTGVGTLSGNVLTIDNEDNDLLFTKSGDGWYIQQKADNRYVYCDGSHGSCQLSADAPENLWTIEMADGAATIYFEGETDTFYFHYTLYNTTKEFCPVKNTEGTVDLYEKQ